MSAPSSSGRWKYGDANVLSTINSADLRWAMVDYTDVAGFLEPGFFLLDVRNADDISVYRHPDYRPS